MAEIRSVDERIPGAFPPLSDTPQHLKANGAHLQGRMFCGQQVLALEVLQKNGVNFDLQSCVSHTNTNPFQNPNTPPIPFLNLKLSRVKDQLVTASRGSSQKAKFGFHPPFDLGVFFSLLPWVFWGSPLLSLSSSRFTLVFDMVAEHQCHDSGQCSFATSFCPVPSSHDDSTMTRPTNQITSSSGEKERSHWNSKLQEQTDIKMFVNDPKLNPRPPSPTSFDGVKPSYVEWSEEVLTFLSVTGYQEFVPILQAVTGHKDIITKKVFIEGVLSELVEEIKDKNAELEEVTSGVRVVDDQDAESERLKGEISSRRIHGDPLS